jgi:hypothetical protein
VATVAVFCFAAPASAETKVALVVGNSAYHHVPELLNPAHDAGDVAAAFLRLGFSVRLVADANYETMRLALVEFNRKARDAEMAVVFFAGHGMEIGGENWLIPIDAELKTDTDAEQEAISVRAIVLMVSTASKLGLVVLDACRNNPFLTKMRRTIATRDLNRGLARIEPANNVLVAYSAKDGTTAADGNGRNSPFTAALLKYLETPGLEINFLFRNVRDDVIAATGSEQQPFIYGSLSKDALYLKPPPQTSEPSEIDQIAWTLIKETTDETALDRFITQFPKSPLRKEAEGRIAALVAARAAKPAPPPADEVTWNLLKETTDDAALQRFIAQYPNSPFLKEAEARVAALAAMQAAKPVPPGPDEVTWLLLKETTDEAALQRFIGQYPKSPLREEAQARVAALAAEKAARQFPPNTDELTWLLLKDTNDEVALQRFIAQFPNSSLRKQAESRMAALASTQPEKVTRTTSVDRRELLQSLQIELRRVGCFSGAASGEFDQATRSALQRFSNFSSIKLPEDLTPDAISALRAIDKRVCPFVCPEGERLVGNSCIIEPAPRKARRDKGVVKRLEKQIVCPEGERLVGNRCIIEPAPRIARGDKGVAKRLEKQKIRPLNPEPSQQNINRPSGVCGIGAASTSMFCH